LRAHTTPSEDSNHGKINRAAINKWQRRDPSSCDVMCGGEVAIEHAPSRIVRAETTPANRSSRDSAPRPEFYFGDGRIEATLRSSCGSELVRLACSQVHGVLCDHAASHGGVRHAHTARGVREATAVTQFVTQHARMNMRTLWHECSTRAHRVGRCVCARAGRGALYRIYRIIPPVM
jgi:hypothetical protein